MSLILFWSLKIMLSFILKFIIQYLTGNSSNRLIYLITEALSLLITLYVFYISNRLVDPKLLDGSAENFFEFLLIGEIALIIPISFFETIIKNYLEFYHSQFLETLKGMRIPYFPIIIKKSLNELILPVSRVLLIFVFGLLLFNFKVSLISTLVYFIIQFLSLACILFISQFVIQIHLNYKRGLKFIYLLNSILAVIGGAYFPITLLPPFIRDYLVWIFPQSFILQLSRMAFAQKSEKTYLALVFFIVYIAVVAMILKPLIKGLERRRLRNRFKNVVFTNTGHF